MRILQVVYSCMPGEYRGGVSKVGFDLSRELVAQGHEVEVFTTNYNSRIRTAMRDGDTVIHDGVRIRYFEASSPGWMRSPSMAARLKREIKRFDVVHSHNTFLALNRYASQISRQAGIPLFFHAHGALDPIVVNQGAMKRLKKRVYIRAVERRNLNNAAGIIALTDREREQIRHWGIRAPIFTLPNGVDVPHELKSPVQGTAVSPGETDEKSIVFLGRLVRKKAIHLLIEAFSVVYAHYPGLKLVIAGDRSQDPEYMGELDALIVKHGLVQAVEFPGFLTEATKYELLRSATVFSHVTESEGMALSILEAMAAGVPTLVSKECYMDAAAAAGAVIETGLSAGEIAESLISVLRQPGYADQVGNAAARYIEDHHSWKVIAKQLADIYDAAASARR